MKNEGLTLFFPVRVRTQTAVGPYNLQSNLPKADWDLVIGI